MAETSYFSLRGNGVFGLALVKAIEAIVLPSSEPMPMVKLAMYKFLGAKKSETAHGYVGEAVIAVEHPEGTATALCEELRIVCLARDFKIEKLGMWIEPIVR